MKYKLLVTIFLVLTYSFSMAQKTDKDRGFHTFLGVDVDNNDLLETNGLYVNGVYKGFAAEKAGLQRGDKLKAINGKTVNNFNQLVRTLDQYDPGENVEVSFIRNNQPKKLTANLNDYPEFLKYNSMQWIKKKKLDGFVGDVTITTLGVDVEPLWNEYAVKVTEVINNSGAADAGIETGDTILKMDNYEFATIEELRYYLSKYKPGDIVNLSIIREGEKKQIQVTLGKEIIHINGMNKS